MQKSERYNMTHGEIMRAFVQMLSEMDYQQITITDLAARVKMNRKTFYLHYETLDLLRRDLAEKIALEILRIEAVYVGKKSLPGMVGAIFRYCNRHPGLFEPLFFGPNFHLIFDDISAIIFNWCAPVYPQQPGVYQHLVDVFMFNVFYIYRRWLQDTDPDRPSLDEMITFTEKVVCNGMASLPEYGMSNVRLSCPPPPGQDFGTLFD